MRGIVVLLISTLAGQLSQAQPTDPPRLLPSSITGNTPPVAVVPTSARTGDQPPPPIAQFQDLKRYPEETTQALTAMQSSAAWLVRMQQPNHRFLPGLSPTLKMPLDEDDPVHEAVALWALARVARFTGEPRYATAFRQGFVQFQKDHATILQPVPSPEPNASAQNDQVVLTSLMFLAANEAPDEPALATARSELATRIRSLSPPSGEVKLAQHQEGTHRSAFQRGLHLQALLAARAPKSNAATDAILARIVEAMRQELRTTREYESVCTALPGLVAWHQSHPSPELAREILDHAQWLCQQQIVGDRAKNSLWIGGFLESPQSQPGYRTAYALPALVAAESLAREHAKPDEQEALRQALMRSVRFLVGLQLTAEQCSHFEARFRAHYLLGGVRTDITDGRLRLDSTGWAILAWCAYLETQASKGSP